MLELGGRVDVWQAAFVVAYVEQDLKMYFDTPEILSVSDRFFFLSFLHQNISDTDIHTWTDFYTSPSPLLLRKRDRHTDR